MDKKITKISNGAEYDYQKICKDLLSDLTEKQKEVILRRFALSAVAQSGEGGVRGETLESIGQNFGLTRERVRQIEKDGLDKIRPKLKNYSAIFANFKKFFQKQGGLMKEEAVLAGLGSLAEKNRINFLLSLHPDFSWVRGDENFHSFWAQNKNSVEAAKGLIQGLALKLEKKGQPVALAELVSLAKENSGKLPSVSFASYLGISKKIRKSSEGLWGLKHWPEINPRGVKDKIYLVFKKEQKPLHFSRVAGMIKGSLVQTVHNELIRDPRFILIGRGIYALQDWGYVAGQVKDVISKVLKDEARPLPREEILEKVLSQRLVKPSTVFLNLTNRKYFSRDSQGKYFINEA